VERARPSRRGEKRKQDIRARPPGGENDSESKISTLGGSKPERSFGRARYGRRSPRFFHEIDQVHIGGGFPDGDGAGRLRGGHGSPLASAAFFSAASRSRVTFTRASLLELHAAHPAAIQIRQC
jgi:hypothetical protein